MREHSAFKHPPKFAGRPKKKNRKGGFGKKGFGKNGNSANGNTKNGNVWNNSGKSVDPWQRMLAAHSTSAVCQKCGQPAPDGKLCTFHRNLLNTIRNDFR